MESPKSLELRCGRFETLLRTLVRADRLKARSGSAACTFHTAFGLDLALVGLYNPPTSRQAVSVPASERTTFQSAILLRTETAPTSTNVAQTLSALARQCQDDLGLSGGCPLRLVSDA